MVGFPDDCINENIADFSEFIIQFHVYPFEYMVGCFKMRDQ